MRDEAEEEVVGCPYPDVEAPILRSPQPPDVAGWVVLLGTKRPVAETVGYKVVNLLLDSFLDARWSVSELGQEAFSWCDAAHVSGAAWRLGGRRVQT